MSPEDRRAKQAPLTAPAVHLKRTAVPGGYFLPLVEDDFFSPDKPFWAILASEDFG